MKEPDFDMSADMRLLELQRNSLGLETPTKSGTWESRYAAESSPGVEAVEQRTAPQPLLSVQLSASPNDGVIAGAVVTISLAVTNDGTAPAPGVVAGLSLPGAAAYRMGSFLRDGRQGDEHEAEAFCNEGLELGTLPPGSRATFVLKVSVKLGNGPLLVTPQVRADRVPITGASPVRVGRKPSATTAFGGQLSRADAAVYEEKPLIPVDLPADELPIYELTPEEEIEYEAADAALSSAAERRDEIVETQPVVPEPVAEPMAAEPMVPEPAAVAPVPAEPTPAASVAQPEAPAAPEPQPTLGIVLFGSFDRATLAFFERTFSSSKSPTLLNHCVFGSALACSIDARGDDRYRLREHLAAQSQILHRIALHEKLGRKEPIAEYAGMLLADLGALVPTPIDRNARPAAAKDVLILRCDVPEPTHAVLARLTEERERWDFVRARQLALALQATGVETADAMIAARIDNALRLYAQTAMTMLQKLFVRLRLERSTAVLSQNDPQTDAAARQLLAAMSAAFKD